MFDAASKPIRERNDWAPNKMMTQLDQFNMNLVGQVEWLPISKYHFTIPAAVTRSLGTTVDRPGHCSCSHHPTLVGSPAAHTDGCNQCTAS